MHFMVLRPPLLSDCSRQALLFFCSVVVVYIEGSCCTVRESCSQLVGSIAEI